jgi:hypothetical protein
MCGSERWSAVFPRPHHSAASPNVTGSRSEFHNHRFLFSVLQVLQMFSRWASEERQGQEVVRYCGLSLGEICA